MDILDFTPVPKRVVFTRFQTWLMLFSIKTGTVLDLRTCKINGFITQNGTLVKRLKEGAGISTATDGQSFQLKNDAIVINDNDTTPGVDTLSVGTFMLDIILTDSNNVDHPIANFVVDVKETPADSDVRANTINAFEFDLKTLSYSLTISAAEFAQRAEQYKLAAKASEDNAKTSEYNAKASENSIYRNLKVEKYISESDLPAVGSTNTVYFVNILGNKYLKYWNGTAYINASTNPIPNCVADSKREFYAKFSDFNIANYQGAVALIVIIEDETRDGFLQYYHFDGLVLHPVEGSRTLDYLILKKAGIATITAQSTVSALTGTLVPWTDAKFSIQNGTVAIADTSGYPNNLFCKANYITSQYTAPQYSIEFGLNADSFEIYFKANKGCFRVYVQDFLIYENTTKLNNGNLYYQLITFTAGKAYRKIRIESSTDFYFGGIKVKTADTVEAAIVTPKKKVVGFGDSYSEPSGVNGWFSWIHVAGKLLNWNTIASGSGGTGYTTAGSTAGRYKFIDRINDIVNLNPEIVIIAGGINDAQATTATISTAIDAFYTALTTALPNAKIVIVENWRSKDTETLAWDTISFLLEKKAAQIGATFISNRGWITGNGNVSNQNRTGNADIFIQSDGTHPTELGQIHLGINFAKAYKKLNP